MSSMYLGRLGFSIWEGMDHLLLQLLGAHVVDEDLDQVLDLDGPVLLDTPIGRDLLTDVALAHSLQHLVRLRPLLWVLESLGGLVQGHVASVAQGQDLLLVLLGQHEVACRQRQPGILVRGVEDARDRTTGEVIYPFSGYVELLLAEEVLGRPLDAGVTVGNEASHEESVGHFTHPPRVWN
jgi:hypothetical protein